VKISWYKERFKGVSAAWHGDHCHTFRQVASFSPALEAGDAGKVYLDKGEEFCYKKHKLYKKAFKRR
jgi:hypothetical protein